MQNKFRTILLRGVFILALVGVLPLLGGVGTRLGFWEPLTGFMMTLGYLSVSSVAVLMLIFLSLYFCLNNLKQSIVSFVVIMGFAAGGYVLGVNKEPDDWTGLPGIHDVTTDMKNPPQFVILADAPGRRNSFEYPIETAEKQKAKFPWVKPILTDLSENEAYARAITVANELGWKIAGEDPSRGTFEATDYTKWFYFHDDVIVRVTANENGSRVDVRSLSRVGGTDHGLGAIRIMKFIKKFNEI